MEVKSKFFIYLLILIFTSSNLHAACSANTCCMTFPDAVQVNTTGNAITFSGTNACSWRINSDAAHIKPSALPAGSVAGGCGTTTCNTNHGTATCTNYLCQVKGGTITLGTYPTFSGGANSNNATLAPTTTASPYNTVTANNTTGVTFTGVGCSGATQYYISRLNVNNGGNNTTVPVRFAGGCDYYIKDLDITNNGGTRTINFIVTGSGSARIFVSSATPINWTGGNSNGPFTINTAGTANQFILTSYGTITIDAQDLTMKGIIYSPSTVTISNSRTNANLNAKTNITGAILGQTITLGALGNATSAANANITYDGTALESLTSNNLGGSTNATCSSAPTTGLDTLTLSIPSTATYCSTINATVTAVPPNPPGGANDSAFRDTIAIDTNNGTCTGAVAANCVGSFSLISGHGAFADSGNGYATYTFDGLEPTPGQAIFALTYPATGQASPTIKVRDLTLPTCIASVGSVVNFKPTGFAVTSTSVPASGTIPSGYSTNQTAGTDFSPGVIVTALNGSCGGTNNVTTTYTGTKIIKVCPTYVNPASGTIGLTVNNVNTCSAGGNVTFINGVATLQTSNSTAVNYLDVGNITLNATDSVNALSGTSGNIIVKPAQFVITGFSPSNPAAANASGSVFTSAGTPFTVTVQAQNSQNTLTPNYNLESPPQGFAFAPVAVSGGGNVLGTIAISTPFAANGPAGQFQGALTYSEVGIMQIQTSVGTGSYLGAGNVSTTLATNVGRFTPNNFLVALAPGNNPAFASGCSSGGAANAFTYVGQPLSFTTSPIMRVTARNASNVTTQNYTNVGSGSYKKLTAASFVTGNCGDVGVRQCYTKDTSQPTLSITGTLPTPTEVDNGNGTIDYTFTLNSSNYIAFAQTAGIDVSPFNAAIQFQATVIDTDNVAYASNPFLIGTINPGSGMTWTDNSLIYQGRLNVNNVTGSELLPLTVPMQVQFYNGTGYVTNTKDSCTQLTATSNVILTDPPSGGVTTSVSFTSTPLTFASGLASFTLAAPTGGATGQKLMEIDLTSAGANRPWLQFNWSGSTGNPHAIANFGFYQGISPRVIYQRESFP